MTKPLSRREVLIGGALLLITGCVRQSPVGAAKPEAAAAPAAVAAEGLWYVVARGDSLASISRRSAVAVATIVDANALPAAPLRVGTRLWLPGATAILPEPVLVRAVTAPTPRGPVLVDGDDAYRLVPRKAWTRQPVGRNNQAMGTVRRIAIHHTDEHAGMASLPDVEVVQRIERYHRAPKPNGRGWSAIGYHYLIGKDGKVYEGRPAKYQGAHVSGANENTIGISVIGDYMRHLPNPRQLAALEAFLGDTRARYRLGRRDVFGHRDLGRSDCPGDALYAWLRSYKAA